MIKIVSTKIKSGKGGISTALIGYQQSKRFNEQNAEYLCSHDEKNKLILFFSVIKSFFLNRDKETVYWFHCARWLSLSRKFTFALLAKSKGHKVVFHFHSAKMSDYLESNWKSKLLKIMLLSSDGIVVLTPWWKQVFLKRYPFLKNNIFVAPNPLDAELRLAASEPKIDNHSEKISILSMSRLVEGKGFQYVIRSLLYLPDNYELFIAGDGPYETTLKALVDELKLNDRVIFTGWLSYAKKREIYLKADLFCLPSKYDSFGMCYIEAMAYGVPVVALNYQAIPDVVPDGVAGILCNEDDPFELAQAMLACFRQRKEMSSAAKKYVISEFCPEKISQGVFGFFTKMRVNNE